MRYPKIRSYLLITRYNNKVSIGSSVNRAVEINDPTGEIYQIILKMDGKHSSKDIYNTSKVSTSLLDSISLTRTISRTLFRRTLLRS